MPITPSPRNTMPSSVLCGHQHMYGDTEKLIHIGTCADTQIKYNIALLNYVVLQ